jgi:serine acetyltransferase
MIISEYLTMFQKLNLYLFALDSYLGTGIRAGIHIEHRDTIFHRYNVVLGIDFTVDIASDVAILQRVCAGACSKVASSGVRTIGVECGCSR